MKKILSFMFLCLITFSVFGQTNGVVSLQANKIVDGASSTPTEGIYVPSNTPIVLAPQEQLIGKTKYDTQTNKAFGSRFHRFDDGRVVATWTGGVQNAPSFPDRGSFYNYFDGTSWTANPDNIVRLESERSGWPSWAPLGNGEIVASHAGSAPPYYVNIWTRETLGVGPWTKKTTLPGANIWSRICVNNGVIHLITIDGNYVEPYFPLYYSKSTDGGATWTRVLLKSVLPDFDYSDICYPADSYVWAEPNNGIIALSLAGNAGDFVIYKSADNGATWQKKTAWLTPYKNQGEGGTFDDDVAAPTGAHSIIIDDDGICHMVFTVGNSAGGGYTHDTGISRAVYWNENMAPFSYPAYQNYALDPEYNSQMLTESRLILEMSFDGSNFDGEKMVY
jgi:hypothetical protein